MVLSMWKRVSILCIIAGLILLSACSNKLDSKIERGFELYEQENYPQAIELFQEVLKNNPEDIDVLVLLQAAFIGMEDYDQSVAYGKAILRTNPNNQTTYHQLIYAYKRLERYEDAISCYESLLALSPEDVEVNGHLGLLLAGQGRYEKAIQYLKETLRLKGEDTFILRVLAICLMRLQRYEQAIDAFNRIIKTEKTPELLAKARLKIGDVYYAMGKHGKAIENYSMIELEHNQATYQQAQHYIRSLNNVPDDAKRKIIDGVPFPPRGYIVQTLGACGSATLKVALNFLNDSVSQKSIAEKIGDDDGTTPYALWNFAVERGFQAYLGVADLPKIKYWVNRGYPVLVLILEPEYGYGHFTLVVGYDEIKDIIISYDVLHWIYNREIPTADFQHAWNYYDRSSLFIFPRGVDLPHNFETNIYAQNCLQTDRGGFLYDQGNKEDAFMELEAVVLNQPPLPSTYVLLAKLYANENDPIKNAKADQYLSTALSMSPTNGATLLQAGIFYRIRNENAKATSMFKKGLKLYPHSYELRKELALHYLKIRDYTNAIIELEKQKTHCKRTNYCRDQKQINNGLFVSNVFLSDYGKAIEANQELIELSSTLEEKFQALKKHTALGILHKQPEVAKESLHQILALLPRDDPRRQDSNYLLQAMDEAETVVDVELEKNLERGEANFSILIIKSKAVADSIVHAN